MAQGRDPQRTPRSHKVSYVRPDVAGLAAPWNATEEPSCT